MHWTEMCGWVAVGLAVFVTLPQIVKIYQTKQSQDVAAWTYRMVCLMSLCYLARAIAIREWVFIVSNMIYITMAVWVLLLKGKYDG